MTVFLTSLIYGKASPSAYTLPSDVSLHPQPGPTDLLQFQPLSGPCPAALNPSSLGRQLGSVSPNHSVGFWAKEPPSAPSLCPQHAELRLAHRSSINIGRILLN